MRTAAALAGTALAVVLAGCGSDGGQAEEPPLAPAPTAAPTRIPGELALPGQTEDRIAEDRRDRIYFYVCLDPPAHLRNTRPTDRRTVVVTRDGVKEIERLVVYADSATAAEAVEDFRGELKSCGHGTDHVGNPMSWDVVPGAGLPDADEAFHVDTEFSASRLFLTVVRRGNAVYLVDRKDPPAGHPTAAEAEQEVQPFVEQLCVFDAGCS